MLFVYLLLVTIHCTNKHLGINFEHFFRMTKTIFHLFTMLRLIRIFNTHDFYSKPLAIRLLGSLLHAKDLEIVWRHSTQ